MPTPTAAQIANALKGGTVAYSFRYQKRDHSGNVIADVTPAIQRCEISLDNYATVLRTARFEIDPDASSFITGNHDHVAVIMDLYVPEAGENISYTLGLFIVDRPQIASGPEGAVWTADATDLNAHFMYAQTATPYTVAAGTNYVSAVETIINSLGLGIQHSIQTTVHVTPTAFTWAPGTSWLKIINELLEGIHYYPIFMNAAGVAISRAWDDWHSLSGSVTYTTDDMILAPFTQTYVRDTFFNQAVVVMDDPTRAPFFAKAINTDGNSPVSTVANGGAARLMSPIDGSRFVNQATALAVAKRVIREESYSSTQGTLLTALDPRRQAHEMYNINIPGVSSNQKWVVNGWSFDCATGAVMTHHLRLMTPLNEGAIQTETTDDI